MRTVQPHISALWYLIFFLILPLYAESPKPLDQHQILLLLDSCIASSRSIQSITCRFKHETKITNGTPAILYEGTISYQAPENFLVHYLSPFEEYYKGDDSGYVFYSVAENKGLRFKKTDLLPVEKQIMELISHVRMNTIETMRNGYDFSYVASVGDTDVVLSAVPKAGWKELSKIWIKISAKHRYYIGNELYDKKGTLISQSIYYNPIAIQGTTRGFPTNILIKTINKDQLQIDKIEYTRVSFNRMLSKEELTFALPANARMLYPQKQDK